MNHEPNESPLAELGARLDRLDCLAQSTKRWLIELFSGNEVPSGAVVTYLERRLGFVERFIASINHPAFRDVCQKLDLIDDHENLLSALGLAPPFEPFNPHTWLWHAAQLADEKPSCLYALANDFAIPSPPDPNRDARAFCLLADSLLPLNQLADALWLLEAHRGFEPDDYTSENFTNLLTERLAGLESSAADRYINSLGIALLLDGRDSHAERLFATYADQCSRDRPIETTEATRETAHAIIEAFNHPNDNELPAAIRQYLDKKDCVATPVKRHLVEWAKEVVQRDRNVEQAQANSDSLNRDDLIAEFRSRLQPLDCLAMPTKQSLLEMAETGDEQSLRFFLDNVLVEVEELIAIVQHPKFRGLCESLRFFRRICGSSRARESSGSPVGHDGVV